MLEIRPNCEHCKKDLPPHSSEAFICSFECTFCYDCAHELLKNVCPNCGGNFEKRPIRPKEMVKKYPASKEKIIKEVDMKKFENTLKKYKGKPPHQR